jgi:hypothetical protein
MFSPMVKAEASVFDTLRSIPAGQRVSLAREIYKRDFRRTDSVTTFKGFQDLFGIARELNDKVLECWIYDFHADYFSVNKKFNSQSPHYHQRAIDLAVRYNLPVEVAVHTYKKGSFYYTFKKYVEAYRYFLEAHSLFTQAGLANIPEVSSYLDNMATFYYDIEDFEMAQVILLQALEHNLNSSRGKVNMINTTALTYQRLGKDNEALEYFAKALDLARELKDSTWIGIASGNMASIYSKHGEYEKAIEGLQLDYTLSLKGGENRSAATAMLEMVQCKLALGDAASASEMQKLAEPLVKKVDDLIVWMNYFDNMATLAEHKGKKDEALRYWKRYQVAKDSLQNMNNLVAVNKVKLKWEMDKYTAQVGQLKNEAQLEMFRRNALIGILFLLMVISVLIYNRQKLKGRKEKELFAAQEELLHSERARTQAELFHATQALELYTDNLQQKNAIIEEFKTEIEHLQHQLAGPEDHQRIQYLETLMQTHIMTDETWDEFKKLFEKVHSGFLARLKHKFSYATESDVRLLTLLKLGLSNREMANMLCVTSEAIKKSRQRLRKKMELPEALSLEEVVASI